MYEFIDIRLSMWITLIKSTLKNILEKTIKDENTKYIDLCILIKMANPDTLFIKCAFIPMIILIIVIAALRILCMEPDKKEKAKKKSQTIYTKWHIKYSDINQFLKIHPTFIPKPT